MNPFSLFGIKCRFRVNIQDLESRYRDLSKALHPDRFVSSPATERRMALNKAIEVNEAWRILRDPIRRAEAVLLVQNVQTGELAEPKPSNALLMEMMQVREEIAEASQKRDMQKLLQIKTTIEAQKQAITLKLEKALDDAFDPHVALPLLGEMRYLQRVLDEINAMGEVL